MQQVRKLLNIFKIVIEVLLVILFVLFEELIWKTLALPIKKYLASLELLKGVQQWIERQSLAVTLVIFTTLFTIAEVAGIYAGAFILVGEVAIGLFIYALKIPIAGFTFWMFSFTKEKLLTVKAFKFVYDIIIGALAFVKGTRIYRKVKYSVYLSKRYVKNSIKSVKTGTSFSDEIRKIYYDIRVVFNRA